MDDDRYIAGIAEGERRERERVVAWLKRCARANKLTVGVMDCAMRLQFGEDIDDHTVREVA